MSFLPESNSPRLPIILCLDGSSSMSQVIGGDRNNPFRKIDALNQGLKALEFDIKSDFTIKKTVEIAVIRIANKNPDLVFDWTIGEEFDAPTINAKGMTPTAEAFIRAFAMCEAKKAEYIVNGVDFFRPWIVIMCDSSPTSTTEEWQNAIALAENAKIAKKAEIISFASDGCNTKELERISSSAKVFKLSNGFDGFFFSLSSCITHEYWSHIMNSSCNELFFT